LIERGKQVCML